MDYQSAPGLTQLLGQAAAGDADAQSKLLAAAYNELRRLASGIMRRERNDHTLQPTALLNEAALRMLGSDALANSADRSHFFGAMATAMRRVLVDHARARKAQRRGGAFQRRGLDYAVDAVEHEADVDLVALNEALNQLAALNERQSQIVTWRFFGGMSMPEMADHLQVSLSTVEKDWRLARAWLQRRLHEDTAPPAQTA